jgi:hypothetical protein
MKGVKTKRKIKGPFESTWKRHRVSQCLVLSPKGENNKNGKDKENILGQHKRDMNVSMHCVIPKRKT